MGSANTKVMCSPRSPRSSTIHVKPKDVSAEKDQTQLVVFEEKTPRSQKKELPNAPIVIGSHVVSDRSGYVCPFNVDTWIAENMRRFDGDPKSFLAGPTARTKKVLEVFQKLLAIEVAKGVVDVDTKTPGSILSHKPGFITGDKSDEVIVGLQTDAPMKRMIKPFGGLSQAKTACKAYGYELDPSVVEVFSKYRKTHNDGVFDVYTPEMRKARHSHIITGLPDSYARGRIVGDYRRVALYGVAKIIEEKNKEKNMLKLNDVKDQIQLEEEIAEQVKALKQLVQMAKMYGEEFDLMRPAATAQEAIQWTYFGYLAAIKQQDGAAMSMGRLDSFFDIFIEKDLAAGKITEEQAQDYIDDFVVKCRMVRHLRTPEYNELFSGDPTWVTMTLGGIDAHDQHMVTKTSYRILQTLYNLGPAPEPNITVLWSVKLPNHFKNFAATVSIDTSAIQYESDDIMRPVHGSDYTIACCVSPMVIGKEMQFFGARCNLGKLLLYSINEGKDEVHPEQVSPPLPKLSDGPLQYEEVMANFRTAMVWMAELYANTMNRIHFMHDKYYYEALQMALHNSNVHRWMAFGIAGLSVIADSLSAIKYAKVTPVRDLTTGITQSFVIEGDFPKYGNDDDRVDSIAREVVHTFVGEIRKHALYRNASPTMSVLTITSNVVYGKHTGATPDGRPAGAPFAPGANPMHGRDSSGALCSLNSVASIPFEDCADGISNTFSIVPSTLGKTAETRSDNLVALLDGYFTQGAQHLNVNVLNRDTLLDAVAHPENHPNLTIRVSGYAVHFTKLTHAQQLEVISRTFHSSM